ncbi:MAG: 4a-hydroxytetrahydrobiopterin dehydratase [Verrucomicrobiota bacterium]
MMAEKLSKEEVLKKIHSLEGWSLNHEKLHKDFFFENFVEAFSFMTAVALEAEKMNHHPEWTNVWATVKVSLSTHDADGITEPDIELAQKMDTIAARFI